MSFGMVLPKSYQFFIQTGNTWVHQRNLRERRLLNWAKFISIPSKPLIFLFPNDPHQGEKSNVPRLVPSFPSPILLADSLTDLGITHEMLNHLKISNHNLVVTLQCNNMWSMSSRASLLRKHLFMQTIFHFLRFSIINITPLAVNQAKNTPSSTP